MAVIDSLTEKVGPLPVWAWASAASVLIVGYQRLKPKPAAAPAVGDANAAGQLSDLEPLTDPFGDFTMTPSPLGSGTWAVAPSGSGLAPSTVGADEIDTNDEWVSAVSKWAVNVQRYDPLVVFSALGKFLQGNELDVGELAVVRAALQEFGQPPSGAPPILRAPAPTAPPPVTVAPTAPPPAITGYAIVNRGAPRVNIPLPTSTVTPVAPVAPVAPAETTRVVAAGSTLYQLFRGVYGSYPSVTQVRAIAAYNGLRVGPGPAYNVSPWSPGQTIKFPTQKP